MRKFYLGSNNRGAVKRRGSKNPSSFLVTNNGDNHYEYTVVMDKQAIYNALDPSKWLESNSLWDTAFVACIITFDTAGVDGCTYLSSAPIQNLGLYGGTSAQIEELPAFIDGLRLQAAQRLFDLHATAIIGQSAPGSVFDATA
jgi:hypothetical protein